MTDTPRCDAIAELNFDPAVGFGVAAIDLARELERRLREQDRACGEMKAKLVRAERERDAAIERAHNLRLEAKGYHGALMRCERDARRWQWLRKRVSRFWDYVSGPAADGQLFRYGRDLDAAIDKAMNEPPPKARRRKESSTRSDS